MKITLYLLLMLAGTIHAAPYLSRNYAYRYFSTRDGLAQMQLMCAFQDSDGFVWFGTKGGVSKWDGTSFKNYTTENGLPMGEIFNIAEWGDKKLIFTARKMAIIEQNDSVYVYDLPERIVLPGFLPKSLVIDNNNLFVFGLMEEYKTGLNDPSNNYIFNIKTKKFNRLTQPNFQVVKVVGDHIVTTNALYLYADKKISKKLQFPYDVCNAIFDKNFEKCALEKLHSNSYELYNIENGQFIPTGNRFVGSSHRSTWLPDGSFLSLSNGEHQFLPQRTAKLHYKFTYPNFSFLDKENNLWIGTENGLYNFFNLTIEEYNFNLGAPDNIWSIVEDKVGTMWLGSYGNGLYTMDKNERIKNIDLSAKLFANTKVSNKLIYMGSTTNNQLNTLYISTSNGVMKFVNGEYKSISNTPGCLYAYFDKQTNEIMYSGMDTVSQRRGLFTGMGERQKFYPFEKGFPICIVRDGNNKVRVGAFRGSGWLDNGKLIADTAKREYTGVVSMALDNKNCLWKATEKGIYVELPNGEEYRVARQQLTGAYTSLAVYNNKYIVVGGVNGFAIIDIRTSVDYDNLAVVNIGHDGGFTGLESGQNGICIDSEGYVWLTTALNVLKFRPDDIVKNHFHYTPLPRISAIAYSTDNTHWRSHFFSDGEVKIAYDNKFFRIDYIANSISAPKSLRFRYRLVGLSDKWSEPVYTKSVNYTNMRSGKYRFEVQSSLNGIVWSDIVQSPDIIITVPFYLRPIAFLFYLLVIIALSVFFTKTYTKQKQQRKIEELSRKQLQNELQLNTLRSKIIPHFTKNVLSAIGHFAMTDKLKAGHFISVFSKFSSLTLANADKNYVALSVELEYIEKYLELEKMRFGDRFSYEIIVAADVNANIKIPTMTLHTYCDNAIRHGLIPKPGKGNLHILVEKRSNVTIVTVEDDGIGRKRSNELGTHGNGQGLLLVQSQIDFYNLNNAEKMRHRITDLFDKESNSTGTRIELYIPDNYLFN